MKNSVSNNRVTFVLLIGALAMLSGSVTGCGGPSEDEYVARVGDRYLLRKEVASALATMPAGLDSLEASTQFVEGWVTNEVLALESERQGLMNDPEIKTMLEENIRSVLISALLEKLNQDDLPEPGPAEIEAYFTQNQEDLALRDDYLQVRYLQAETRAQAESARRELARAIQRTEQTDSLWQIIVERYAMDKNGSLTLANNYVPEGRLTNSAEPVWQQLSQIADGELAPVIEINDSYHVLQVVDRVPRGTPPRLMWIRNEIRELLRIRARKEAYSNYVRQLKNEAISRNDLVIVTDDNASADVPSAPVPNDSTSNLE